VSSRLAEDLTLAAVAALAGGVAGFLVREIADWCLALADAMGGA
jgi:hypothetical protein